MVYRRCVKTIPTPMISVSSTRSQALAVCTTHSGAIPIGDCPLSTIENTDFLFLYFHRNVAVGAGCVDAVSSPTINEAIFPIPMMSTLTANHDSENNLAYYVNFVDGSDGVADTHASKLPVRVRGDYMDGVCGNDFTNPVKTVTIAT